MLCICFLQRYFKLSSSLVPSLLLHEHSTSLSLSLSAPLLLPLFLIPPPPCRRCQLIKLSPSLTLAPCVPHSSPLHSPAVMSKGQCLCWLRWCCRCSCLLPAQPALAFSRRPNEQEVQRCNSWRRKSNRSRREEDPVNSTRGIQHIFSKHTYYVNRKYQIMLDLEYLHMTTRNFK